MVAKWTDGDVAASIAQAITTARERRKLSKNQLANACGVARQNVVRWENGTHVPTIGTLLLVAKATGTTVAALVRGVDRAHAATLGGRRG